MSCEDGLVRIIPPLTLTDAMLTSTNVAENDHPVYDPGTAYADGATVIVTTGVHRIYQNNSGSSQTGVYPPDNPLIWEDKGATNAWRMFDNFSNTITSNAESIDIQVEAGFISNSIALIGLGGSEVIVTVTDPVDGVVYSKTMDLRSSEGIVGLYSWLFRDHSKKTTIVLSDLPAYRNATIRIQINATGGTAECGMVAMGRQKILGELLYGFSLGIIDYSRKTTNDEGVTSVQKRAYADEPEISMKVELSKFDNLKRVLSVYRSTPAIYVCGTQYDTMTVYGFYRDFRQTVPHSAFAECTLQIEGLI